MPKITLMQGLPASGKTTYVTNSLAELPKARVISTRSICEMLRPESKDTNLDAVVLGLRDEIISRFMRSGVDIFLDDMNLEPGHALRVRDLIDQYNKEILAAENPYAELYELKVTQMNAPVEVLIDRDRQRPNSTGEKKIRSLAKYYSKINDHPTPNMAGINPYIFGAPPAVVCDIDNFLSDDSGDLNEGALETVRRFCNGPTPGKLVIVTMRDTSQFQSTLEWLFDHNCPVHTLLMRHVGDRRSAQEVKVELFHNYLQGFINVRLIIEEDDDCADVWQRLGLFVVRPHV